MFFFTIFFKGLRSILDGYDIGFTYEDDDDDVLNDMYDGEALQASLLSDVKASCSYHDISSSSTSSITMLQYRGMGKKYLKM
jgi:hypothetical protein